METLINNGITAIPFADCIEQLTKNFTGRDWIFREIDDWLNNKNERFFIVTGEPGVGKSAITAQLTKIRKDVVAYHFCRAGNVETINPGRILRSLAAQLGEKLELYGEALANTIEPHLLQIKVSIDVKEMSGGKITGVYIENLKPSDLENELEILIRAPLAELEKMYVQRQQKPPALATILIDSLDEAITVGGKNLVRLLEKLSNSDSLPSWVRFILTSRPEERVLRYFNQLKPYQIDKNLPNNLNDIKWYIEEQVKQEKFQKVLHKNGIEAKDLIEKIAHAEVSGGNFLYTELLLKDIEAERQSLNDLSNLPQGINDIYHNFLRRLEKKWENCYQPILGALTVIKEPVTENELARFTGIELEQLKQHLNVVRQFLTHGEKDRKGKKTWAIFHQSMRDYLTDDKQNQHFWCDVNKWHKQIANSYLKDFPTWGEEGWKKADTYGLLHLPFHLDASEQDEKLYALLTDSPDWMEAKFNAFSSDAAYVDDLELAINKFSDPLKPNELLTLTKLYTARQVVHQRSNSYDERDLKTLVWLGEEKKALSFARLRADLSKKIVALLSIYEALQAKAVFYPDALDKAKDVLDEAKDITAYIEDNSRARTQARRNLALALVRAGRIGEAEKIAGEIKDSWVYTEVMQELAVTQFQDQSANEDRDFSSDIEESEEAVEVFQDLAEDSVEFEYDGESNEVFSILGETPADVEGSEEAYRLRNQALNLVKAGNRKTGMEVFRAAMEVPNGFEKGWEEMERCREFAETLLQAGFVSEAAEIFTRSREAANFIQGNWEKAEALRNLAASIAQASLAYGQFTDLGREVFSEAKQLAPATEKDSRRKEAQSKWAAALSKFGLASEASAVFIDSQKLAQAAQKIQIAWSQQAKLLPKVLAVADMDEYFAEAEKCDRAIEDDQQREAALNKLATTLAGVKRFTKALSVLELKDRPNQFLENLAVWVPAFENVERQLAATILKESTRIFGWMYPYWQEIYTQLYSSKNLSTFAKEAQIIEPYLLEVIKIVYGSLQKNQAINIDSTKQTVRKRIIRQLDANLDIFIDQYFEKVLVRK